MLHTGLSVKDEIGMVARPWTVFFASRTSSRRASPWLSGKLKYMQIVRHSLMLKKKKISRNLQVMVITGSRPQANVLYRFKLAVFS